MAASGVCQPMTKLALLECFRIALNPDPILMKKHSPTRVASKTNLKENTQVFLEIPNLNLEFSPPLSGMDILEESQ